MRDSMTIAAELTDHAVGAGLSEVGERFVDDYLYQGDPYLAIDHIMISAVNGGFRLPMALLLEVKELYSDGTLPRESVEDTLTALAALLSAT